MTTVTASPLIPFTQEEIERFKQDKEAPSKEIVKECVIELRKWLAQQHHLPKLDDELLNKYLFGCKYNMDEAKIRLNKYYAFRARNGHLFSDRDPLDSEHRTSMKTVHLAVMPKATKEGYRIQLGIMNDPDPEFYSPKEIFKQIQAISDLILRDEREVCSPGVMVIISGMSVTMSHVIKWDLSMLKAVADTITKSRPESIKGIHFIDCPNSIKPVILLLTSLLSSKLKKRISYNEPEALYEKVPREMLPDEFGGTAGPVAKYADAWIDYVIQNRDWLMKEGTIKADLDLMPKENEHAVFIDSFRKLDVD